MKVKTYRKLVRDRIPEIIHDAGKTCKIRVLSDEEFQEKVDQKLHEELAEYDQEHSLEELADLLEVVYAAAAARGASAAELEELRRKKAEKRGGFEKKLFLETVEEE